MLAFQESVTVCWACVTPFPEIGIADGAPVALLTMASVPAVAAAVVGEYCTVKVMLCEGDRVTADPPDNDKFDPFKTALDMATLELPVFVSVTIREAVVPTFTFPKFTLRGFTARVKPGATPAPLNAMAEGGFEASLTRDKLPVEGPADLGSNFTLKIAVLPALNVIGSARPEELKPAPEILAAEIVTGTVPGLAICTVCVLATPVTALPKLIFAGDRVSPDCDTVPDTLTLVMPPWALTREISPLLVLVDVGLYFTVKIRLSPGTTSTGVAIPAVENPAPLRLICESVTLAVPTFFSVVTAEAVLPSFTLLKLRAAGVAISFPIV